MRYDPLALFFRPQLPISDEDRLWVENGFDRLCRVLGRNRMLHARVILPDAEYFPDPYDKNPAAAQRMFARICHYMQVDRSTVDLEVFPDAAEELGSMLPYWRADGKPCAAGVYFHPEDESKKMVVALRQSKMDDPIVVVATLAHELGHVILLGGGLMDHAAKDMEPMTDLVTVFLGFGIFTANCAARFRQWQDNQMQGWSMQRLGYLPEAVYGYALALFAHQRGEHRPDWARRLSGNVRSYFKMSANWLEYTKSAAAEPIN